MKPSPSIRRLKRLLGECGYAGSRLKEGYVFGEMTVPLVGFSAKPWDFDSACIAVVSAQGDSRAAAASCRDLGAPVVWVGHNGSVDWWVQHHAQPTLYASKPASEFEHFVLEHKEELQPQSIYRGKTIARVDHSRQLDFVDAGLLPLLREEAGKKLHDLVEGMTRELLNTIQRGEATKSQTQSAFLAVFRLLAGKILKDKGVSGFKTLDLSKPKEVLLAVERHYSEENGEFVLESTWQGALEKAAAKIAGSASFAVVSPETLAYVYEHTFVTKSLRRQLGIHATPPWLVDYLVWQLDDWIRDIPESDRHVFEPTCGHAPFLLAAMRLLRLEASHLSEQRLHQYLKAHIHGVEIDDFAREIARLSLTLADVPNPNGWDLRNDDAYASDILMKKAAGTMVLLSNPPFERFSPSERRECESAGFPVNHSKAVELMDRTLHNLPVGAVFALVLPQAVLHSTEARRARELLLRSFEVREICLFADKVFEEGEPETVILIGRKTLQVGLSQPKIRYRRVRENGIRRFASDYKPDSEYFVSRAQLGREPSLDFRVPDVPEVWAYLARNPVLSDAGRVGQGFSFAERGAIAIARNFARQKARDSVSAFIEGHTNVPIWSVPESSWISPQRTPIAPWRGGGPSGEPQVLVNYVRAMRGPWRLKAFMDSQGNAALNTYLTVRPVSKDLPVQFLWALLNSPIANAFVYCHSMQKHNYDGLISKMPLPMNWEHSVGTVVSAARAYCDAVASGEEQFLSKPTGEARRALLMMDAEVLKLYDLPPRLERQLLDLFDSVERKGVGCNFDRYYPPGFTSYLPLHVVISDSFQRAAADKTVERFKPGSSDYVTSVLRVASEGPKEK